MPVRILLGVGDVHIAVDRLDAEWCEARRHMRIDEGAGGQTDRSELAVENIDLRIVKIRRVEQLAVAARTQRQPLVGCAARRVVDGTQCVRHVHIRRPARDHAVFGGEEEAARSGRGAVADRESARCVVHNAGRVAAAYVGRGRNHDDERLRVARAVI